MDLEDEGSSSESEGSNSSSSADDEVQVGNLVLKCTRDLVWHVSITCLQNPWRRLSHQSSFSNSLDQPSVPQDHFNADYFLSQLGQYPPEHEEQEELVIEEERGGEAAVEELTKIRKQDATDRDTCILAPYTSQDSCDECDGDRDNIHEQYTNHLKDEVTRPLPPH